jgi:hypothetical protein
VGLQSGVPEFTPGSGFSCCLIVSFPFSFFVDNCLTFLHSWSLYFISFFE